MKFTIDPEGIALDAETIIDLQRFEVQSVGAVVLTRHGDVLAVEHLWIALHAPGQRLDECIMRVAREELIDGALLIELQNAQITLARLHLAVAVQNGLQIHGQIRVTVPTLKVGVLYF